MPAKRSRASIKPRAVENTPPQDEAPATNKAAVSSLEEFKERLAKRSRALAAQASTSGQPADPATHSELAKVGTAWLGTQPMRQVPVNFTHHLLPRAVPIPDPSFGSSARHTNA